MDDFLAALIMSDDFAGDTLDRTRWRAYNNSYGSDHTTVHCNKPENVTLANGIATIAPPGRQSSAPTVWS
ncbi:MAG: hypothetical protein IPL43_13670 [Micropruina sp.]|nr:hypothetical protein [Micropruina sp.]